VVLDADHCGQMIHEVRLGDQTFEDLDVEHAVANVMEGRVAHEVTCLVDRAGIEDEHLVPAGNERIGKMGADKTAAAGDQNLHVNIAPPRTACRSAQTAPDSSASPSSCTRASCSVSVPVRTCKLGVTAIIVPGTTPAGDALDTGDASQTYNVRCCHD